MIELHHDPDAVDPHEPSDLVEPETAAALESATAPTTATATATAPGDVWSTGWRTRTRAATRWAPVRALLWIGSLLIWAALFLLVLTPIQAHRSQRNEYAMIRSEIVAQTIPFDGHISVGTPIALMQIPSIGVGDTVIAEGTTPEALENGPGHRRDTPLPGQEGVSVVMGRSSLYGAPFERVPALRVGAVIQLTTGQGEFVYSVDGVRRAGDPGPSPVVVHGGRLTLVTSERIGSGLGAHLETVYVDATLQGVAAPAAPDRPTVVDDRETTMRGDPSSLQGVVLWLTSVIAVLLIAERLRHRWGGARVLLGFAPILFATLWLLSESVTQLLPNLW